MDTCLGTFWDPEYEVPAPITGTRTSTPLYVCGNVNPFMTNGITHRYHLGESTFILGDIRCDFIYIYFFSIKFLYVNRIAPDGTPRSAASHLGL